MSNRILVSHEAYKILRQDSREALGRLGVGSNPCFTDHNIVAGLGEKLGQNIPDSYDEVSEYSGEFFRDSLASVLGVEIPASVAEVRAALNRI